MKVAAAVLAAGLSRRMGAPKPIADAGGKPLAGWIIEALLAVDGLDPLLVVTGHEGEEVERRLGRYPVRFLRNQAYAAGMAGSIRTAVAALSTECDALLVVPADMPMIGSDLVARLVAAAERDRIVVPVNDGKRGHPVLFGAQFFGTLASLEGDQGGRSAIERHGASLVEIAVEDGGILLDIDTQAELARWHQERNP